MINSVKLQHREREKEVDDLPEGYEDVCEGLDGGKSGKDDPVHHPFDLQFK